MRDKIAPVKNVLKVKAALGELNGRYINLPGMAALTGESGLGKTSTVGGVIVQANGIYVRALAIWTPYAMLRAVAHELGLENTIRRTDILAADVMSEMIKQDRPLFVDEANHFDRDGKMLHLLRDIHDITSKPVVLVSEEKLNVKLKRYPQVLRRITEWVEFKPLDREDVQTLATTVCEVEVDAELLDHILSITNGNMRDCTTALARIERIAHVKKVSKMTRSMLGNERLIYGAR